MRVLVYARATMRGRARFLRAMQGEIEAAGYEYAGEEDNPAAAKAAREAGIADRIWCRPEHAADLEPWLIVQSRPPRQRGGALLPLVVTGAAAALGWLRQHPAWTGSAVAAGTAAVGGMLILDPQPERHDSSPAPVVTPSAPDGPSPSASPRASSMPSPSETPSTSPDSSSSPASPRTAPQPDLPPAQDGQVVDGLPVDGPGPVPPPVPTVPPTVPVPQITVTPSLPPVGEPPVVVEITPSCVVRIDLAGLAVRVCTP